MKKLDLAYAAGFFDGEGCVTLVRQQRRKKNKTRPFYLKTCLKNTHRGAVLWLRRTFGGSSLKIRPYGKMRKLAFDWVLYSRQAAKFLMDVLPYLKIKKAEARLAITFQKHVERYKHRGYRRLGKRKGRPILPTSVLRYRESLREKIRHTRTLYNITG